MREGYRHPARISHDTEHLHHHRWDLLEEAEREKVKGRKRQSGKGLGEREVKKDM